MRTAAMMGTMVMAVQAGSSDGNGVFAYAPVYIAIAQLSFFWFINGALSFQNN